ncbi:hypothetical protein Ddye_009181 [Dipteronia dyeriana]|uniref:VQ domain-containing protein n=1 Tax=Dipteronia dyeriana TaxID=168575 RepID=A0AAD9XB40_9ROSI|nr:hypothetical protein Ddye_009181 [Dipteronia dyeriana]
MDDSSSFPAASNDKRPPSKSQLQLQGPRPPPLSVHKDSHKIKKPPKPPLDHRHHHHHQQPPPQPVIIYAVSPKIIHATADDFMTTVQRLTGVSSDNFCSGGDVSPAARLASIERVSPKAKGTTTTSIGIVEEGTEISRIRGILSPATMPPVIQEMYFSPATEPNQFNYNFHGSGGFLASPSGLFSGPTGHHSQIRKATTYSLQNAD